ncbi:MAG: sensor histidine kinase [Bacteriovoracaceae bacterium]
MNEAILFIFFFLILTTLVNFIVAVSARIKTQHKEFNLLIFYWLGLFLTYGAVALLSKNPTQIALAYFFQFIPAFIKTKILRDARGIETNWKNFLLIQLIGSAISAFMLLRTDLGFTLSLLPITFTTTLPYWTPVWNILVKNWKESNWIEKGLSFVLFTSIINHFNYAFFRLDPSAAWWGWGISIAQYQSISLFLLLLINHRKEVQERNHVNSVLQKISGQSQEHSGKIDELYQLLEIQILQKEEFYNQLQISNEKLEEEREVNDILIKTISHDLANPLSVSYAYVDMMRANKIPENEIARTLDRMKGSLISALDMMGRIRDAILNRTQANLISVTDVSLDFCIKKLIESFDTKLREKNISMIYQNNIGDVFVLGEENALIEHVFSNVLSNAIKFSFDNSKIIIHVEDQNDFVQISFKDFGLGIDQTRLNKRLLYSTAGTKGEVGSGFGLMVMGYFLRKFGATYSVTSNIGPDHGTTVFINLKKSDPALHFLPNPKVGSVNLFN